MTWKYFSDEELACKCGHCDGGEMSASFMVKLEGLREECGFPFIVTSAYRCPEHNAEIGGAKNSQHIYGRAVDIAVSGFHALRVIELARRNGINGIGISQKGKNRFIHLDSRPDDFAIWTY